MKINIITVGYLQTNCYILENEEEVIIIDPGDEPLKIEKSINKKLVGIIITHGHNDHVGAVDYFKNKYHVPIYDYNNLKEGFNKIQSFCFDVIYTSGHTEDSISIYFPIEKKIFVGDFVGENY